MLDEAGNECSGGNGQIMQVDISPDDYKSAGEGFFTICYFLGLYKIRVYIGHLCLSGHKKLANRVKSVPLTKIPNL